MKKRIADMPEGTVFGIAEHPSMLSLNLLPEWQCILDKFSETEVNIVYVKTPRGLAKWDLTNKLVKDKEYEVIGHIGPDGKLTEVSE